MAVANFGSDDVSVLLNQGDGTFASQTRYDAGAEPGAWRWAIWTGTATSTWPSRTPGIFSVPATS